MKPFVGNAFAVTHFMGKRILLFCWLLCFCGGSVYALNNGTWDITFRIHNISNQPWNASGECGQIAYGWHRANPDAGLDYGWDWNGSYACPVQANSTLTIGPISQYFGTGNIPGAWNCYLDLYYGFGGGATNIAHYVYQDYSDGQNLHTIIDLYVDGVHGCGFVPTPVVVPSLTNNVMPALWLPATGSYQGVAGVPGGIDQYSSAYTNYCNVRTSIPGTNIVAVGDGVADDTDAVNAAVRNAPNGSVVYLPEGTYRITSPIQRQNPSMWDGVIHPYSIIIRGAGMGKTVILNEGGGEAIWLMNNSGWVGLGLAEAPTRGSTSVTTSATFPSGGTVLGQWMFILHDNQTAGVYAPTNTDPQQYYVTYENAAVQAVKVTNISGNTVTFWPPLNEGYANSTLKVVGDPPLRCGIEHLTVVQLREGNASNIRVSGGEECWVSHVESWQARRYHIDIQASAACEIRGCYVHEPFPNKNGANGGGSSDYGICLGLGTCATLVEDNMALHCRHSFIMETGCGQNNVIAYNFGKDNLHEGLFTTDWQEDTDYHGGEQRWCLWEGNVVPLICADAVEGATRYVTYFRNFVTRDGLPTVRFNMYAVNLQRGSWYDTVCGNVYANTSGLNSAGTPAYLLGSWQVFSVADAQTGQLDNHADANAYYTEAGSNLLRQFTIEAKTLNKFYGNYDMSSAMYDYNVGGNLLFTNTFSMAAVPASLLYNSRPAWYGNATWPPFGGDVSGFTNLIPAQIRAGAIARFSETVNDGYALTIAASNGTAVGSGNQSYFNGALVSLLATPDAGYSFTNWTGYPVASSNAVAAWLLMPASNLSLTANFVSLTTTPGVTNSVPPDTNSVPPVTNSVPPVTNNVPPYTNGPVRLLSPILIFR